MTHLETQDQLGNGTQQDFRTLTQNYRLNFDRMVSPAFTIGAGGLFEARRTWTDDASGARTLDGNVRGLYGRLTMNLPTLTSGLSYDLNSEQVNALPSLVNENLSLYASWRPLDLPELNLRLSRTHQYDTSRVDPGSHHLERARLGPVPHRTPSSSGTSSSGRSPRTRSPEPRRARSTRPCRGSTAPGSSRAGRAVYVSLTLRNQMLKTLTAGSGTVSLQQHPVAGLSLVGGVPRPARHRHAAAQPRPHRRQPRRERRGGHRIRAHPRRRRQPARPGSPVRRPDHPGQHHPGLGGQEAASRALHHLHLGGLPERRQQDLDAGLHHRAGGVRRLPEPVRDPHPGDPGALPEGRHAAAPGRR